MKLEVSLPFSQGPVPHEDHIFSAVSYPPYLEAVSSIHNPRTRHALLMRIHISWHLISVR